MQPLIDNARRFGQRPEEFAPPTAGQSPTDATTPLRRLRSWSAQ